MIANQNMMLSALTNAISSVFAKQKYRTHLTHGIEYLQQVDEYTYEALVVLTKVESLEFSTTLPTEGEFIVNDTVRRGLEKANYELVADLNADGRFPKIKLIIECQPHTPKSFKIVSASRDDISLSDLTILTHTHALGSSSYPELARVEVEKVIQQLSQDAILRALNNAWNPDNFEGITFTAAGNINVDTRFAQDIETAKKVISHYSRALMNATEHLTTLEMVLPVKALTESGDNEMTIQSCEAVIDDVIDLFEKMSQDLTQCKSFTQRYAPNLLKSVLASSVAGLLSDVSDIANTWGMRLESYTEEVTTRGLSKRELSDGYVAHREIVGKTISIILTNMIGPLESAYRCLNTIEVE